MKVLHLISGGDTGGAKSHIVSLLKGLNKSIDAKVICFIEGPFYDDAKNAGIDIEVFNQKNRFDLSVINRLVDEIKKGQYEIIHCHGARANFIGVFLKNKVKLPLITTMHSDYRLDFKDNIYKRIVFTTLNSMALKKFDYYIVVSDTYVDMLVDRGFDREKIFVSHNGIDFEGHLDYLPKDDFLRRYKIDDTNKHVVGILARLELVKDHETFIKAANIVLKERDDILFLIAGDGNSEEKLKKLVEELGIQDGVRFLGFIKDSYSFINALDINVLTSLSEGFPYVILEGARMKKTIISTDVGGISKLINNEHNGYLIEVGDYEALSDRILKLIDNEDMLTKMGQQLYIDAKENFSFYSMAKTHVEIYNNVLKR